MSTPDEPTNNPPNAIVTALLDMPMIRQALRDILDIYSIAGQSAETLRTIHDQIQALAEIATLIYSLLIRHNRLTIKNVTNVSTIVAMLQAQAQLYADPAAEISQAMAAAIAQLHTEMEVMLADIAVEEEQIKDLIATARDTAQGIVRSTETLRADMAEEETVIREDMADAATRSAAHDGGDG